MISLAAGQGVVHQKQVFPLSPGWPTQEWPANAVAWGYYTLRASSSLPAGDYDLTLALVDPTAG